MDFSDTLLLLETIWIPLVSSFAVTFLGGGLLIGYLLRQQALDIPNERSSHKVPTPRGGGLMLILVVFLGYFLNHLGAFPNPISIAAPTVLMSLGLVLAAVSWWDDRYNLSAKTRLLVQFLVLAATIFALSRRYVLFVTPEHNWLMVFLLSGVTLFIWLWFVNLYNFMDGIDGICGVQSACLSFGLLLVYLLNGQGLGFSFEVVLIAGILGFSLGFLRWNWSPARIFMGDVGSIPLGFWLGGCLLMLGAAGHWAQALLLPMYYLIDATYTICRRLIQGEKIWQAHRSHFYQVAAIGFQSHAEVVKRILVLNIGLIALAGAVSLGKIPPLLALIFGVFACALQCWRFGLAKPAQD